MKTWTFYPLLNIVFFLPCNDLWVGCYCSGSSASDLGVSVGPSGYPPVLGSAVARCLWESHWREVSFRFFLRGAGASRCLSSNLEVCKKNKCPLLVGV